MDTRKKWVVFEEATPLDFRFFVHVSIFQILDIYSTSNKSIQKNRSTKISLNNFSGHKACSFFWKKSPLAREVSLEENDRMLQSRFSGSAPRPSQVDVGGSVLDGLSKMSVGGFSLLRRLYFFYFYFFADSLNIVHPIFGAFFFEDQLVKRWPRRKAWYLRTGAGSTWWWCWFLVTQDLVQVLATAWDEFGCCPSDTDMDGHFGLAKCKRVYL